MAFSLFDSDDSDELFPECTQLQYGYDYQFVEEPSDDLKCLICLCVARDPQQHGNGGCGKIFCANCIKKHKLISSIRCPHCRKVLTTFKDERSERDIQSLKVKCENYQQGCPWTRELRSAAKHPMCGYVKVPCSYKCEGGNKKLFRKDLQQHLAKECPRRLYNCPHCNKPGEYKDITSQEHINICPKFIIACPNAPSCKISFDRENKLDHISTCKYQEINCKYSELGCKTIVMRKDLPEHENNYETHIVGAMATVLSLKQQCSLLTSTRLHNLNTNDQKMFMSTFKMPLFTQRKEKDVEFFSDPFYTHPNCYKMVFCVDANGYDEYKGTGVSVWVFLMRGDYDDQLEFPFKGTVTFELLNQIEDKIHHSASYTFEGTEPSSKRVIDEEMSSQASGIFAFIHHENLGHNITENCQCQYLKDDCLVFRVSVNVPSYKPWLQCL